MKTGKRLFKGVLAASVSFTSVFGLTISNDSMKLNAAENKDYVEYTNTLFGTNDNTGSTSAGPTRPNGSIHPSPETTSPDNGGYHKGNSVIGFGQLYAQGTGGTKSYGNFLISPQTGEIKTKDGDHASPVSEETGHANYYTAKLDKYGIKAEVVPDNHSAIYRFTYPKNEDASLLIDVSRKIGGEVSLKNGSISIDKEHNRITGGGTFGKNWNPSDWNMYFTLEFDQDFEEIGTWDNGGLKKDSLSLEKGPNNNEHFGAYVKFDTSADQDVNVKISISFDSVEKANEFLNKEIPAFDFEEEKTQAEEAWNDVLGLVELGEQTDEVTKQKFYTALYHTNVQPRNRVEDHGYWDDYYTLWDSWRTVFPFLQLIRPDMVASNINSFIKRYDTNGKISDAFIQGKEYVCGQGGNDIENVIADAYLKGINGVDWEDAYRVVKSEAENYRSKQYIEHGYHYSGTEANNGDHYSSRLKPSSATIGFAYNDYAVAMMAKGLGHEEDYEKYIESSKKWLNNWDENLESSDGYKGFIHKRAQDGSFANVDPSHFVGNDGTEKIWQGYNDDFYEAGIWEGSYSPTFDLPTLVEKMGGKYEYAERLNHALEQGYINFANEPAFQTIWTLASDEVQRPDLASKWVDVYLNKYTDEGYPGDEDNGAMSSMYMFMMSGFFPMSGTNNYYLHGTRLPEMTYHLGTGKDFVIKGINAGGDNIYVQSATWNGQPLTTSKLTWEQIKNGGTLEFVMGNQPSDWARATDHEKPSDVTGLKLDDSKINEGILTLNWNKSTDNTQVKQYNIYCSENENFELDETTYVTSTKETSYTFDVSNKTQYYRVEAEDYFGNKSLSAPTIKVDVSDHEKPVLSGELQLDARYLNVGQVRFNWNPATDNTKIKEYRVYRGTKEKYDLDEESLVTVTADTSYVETKEKGTFYYTVVAVDVFDNVSDPLKITVENTEGLTGAKLDSDENIAKGKTAVASGEHSDKEAGQFAIDGDNKTKWCSQEQESSAKPDFWLEIDLGQVYQLNKWVVKHAEEGGEKASYNTRDFKLQVKSGDEWLDIDSVEGNTDKVTSRNTPMFEGQYLRLYITNPVAQGEARTARIYEVELYGDEDYSTFTGSIMKNPNIEASVNGAANENEGAYAAIDFNPDTKWSCRFQNADNGYFWLDIKLPQTYRVNAMELLGSAKENSEYVTRNFALQVKKDNEWVTIKEVKDNQINLYKDSFDPVEGSEFRLLIEKLGDEGKYNARIPEFHLYGEKVVDKTELEAIINEVKELNKKAYTENSWKELEVALKNAKAVMKDETAIQSEVNAAIEQLKNAKDSLVKLGDKGLLKDAIKEIKALNKKEYTSTSWAKVEEALNHAKMVLNDKNATEEDVTNAISMLKNAKADLVKIAEKTELKKAIKAAEKLDSSKYTKESWGAFEKALADAKAVLAKEDATQEEVNQALDALTKAKAQLVPVKDEGDKPTPPEKTEVPEKPETPENTPDKGNEGSLENPKENTETSDDVNTGAAMQTAGLVTALALGGAAMVYAERKRRLNQRNEK